MKYIITSLLLIFSFPVLSANLATNYIIPTGQVYETHPFAPGTFNCYGEKCTAGQGAPYSFYAASDIKPTDNDQYLYLETGLEEEGYPVYLNVFRDVGAGGSYKAVQDSTFTVTWDSKNLDFAEMKFADVYIDLLDRPSGSLEITLLAGYEFTAWMHGKATSLLASVFFDITPHYPDATPDIGEVPLPPAIFMLAPALIGFLGVRRKYS